MGLEEGQGDAQNLDGASVSSSSSSSSSAAVQQCSSAAPEHARTATIASARQRIIIISSSSGQHTDGTQRRPRTFPRTSHHVRFSIEEGPVTPVATARHIRQRSRDVRERVVDEGGGEKGARARRVVCAPAGDEVAASADVDDGAVDSNNSVGNASAICPAADRHVGAVPSVAALVQRPPAELALGGERRATPARDDAAHCKTSRECHRLARLEEGCDVKQQALLAVELIGEKVTTNAQLALTLQDDSREQCLALLLNGGSKQMPPPHRELFASAVQQTNAVAIARWCRLLDDAGGAVIVLRRVGEANNYHHFVLRERQR